MKTRFIFVTLLSVLVVGPSAFARIGETREQADARYGAPISAKADGYGGFPERTYRKDGVEIVAHFMDEKIGCIEFRKLDGTDFDQDEFKALVRAQGMPISDREILAPKDKTWAVTAPAGINEDLNKAGYATYARATRLLTVFTSAYVARAGTIEETRKRRAAEEKLKGF
jgi:hypothetical protein